ncbi:MAG: chlorophyll synthase ChlG [Pseudomonadota bacterium]
MSHPTPQAVLELLKPVTWFAPMWAFMCGVVSAGFAASGDAPWLAVALGAILAGPLVCGTSQAVNDWFDRDVDAINQPDRPVPSGRVPGRWGLYIGVLWTCLSLAVAAWLGWPVLFAAAFGLVMAWIYSAPPLRLKRNGWWGNTACALCYEGLPWLTGAMVVAAILPDWRTTTVALLYSLGAHGIMTLNDFKSVAGDRRMGIDSLPVQLGISRAALLACFTMLLPQVIVIALLLYWGFGGHALAIGTALAVQLVLMRRLLTNPANQAAWYNATGTTLFVLTMLVAAHALRSGAGLQAMPAGF